MRGFSNEFPWIFSWQRTVGHVFKILRDHRGAEDGVAVEPDLREGSDFVSRGAEGYVGEEDTANAIEGDALATGDKNSFLSD